MLTANVAARVVALASLSAATVLVARAGGPKLLGELTLLRVLPGLIGVLVGCGLPSAAPFFLAGKDWDKGRLRTTIIVLTLAGSLAASACWLLLAPLIHRLFFHDWHMGVVIAAAVPVFTQLWVATGKSFLQGEDDMRGANWAIAAEEAVFLPVYVGLLPFMHGTSLLMTALVGADVLVTLGIAVRLARRCGYLNGWGKPDIGLAKEICGYGIRGQIGGMLSLVNLRLDVAILGALVGPGTLGVYAVASKYAELLRLPGLAITYVLYPRLAARDRQEASRAVVALLPRALVFTVLAAIPLALAVPLLPRVYGDAFTSAMLPACILLFGLIGEGAAGLVSAYLYAVGRPGANSLALGVSVVVTIVLDLMLIPRYHAVGAAAASAVAYLTSTRPSSSATSWCATCLPRDGATWPRRVSRDRPGPTRAADLPAFVRRADRGGRGHRGHRVRRQRASPGREARGVRATARLDASESGAPVPAAGLPVRGAGGRGRPPQGMDRNRPGEALAGGADLVPRRGAPGGCARQPAGGRRHQDRG